MIGSMAVRVLVVRDCPCCCWFFLVVRGGSFPPHDPSGLLRIGEVDARVKLCPGTYQVVQAGGEA